MSCASRMGEIPLFIGFFKRYVFGHVVSGRSFDDSENVVGPMLVSIIQRIIGQITEFFLNAEHDPLSSPAFSKNEQSGITSVHSSRQC